MFILMSMGPSNCSSKVAAGPFEFSAGLLPPDGDLKLKLAECVPADKGTFGVPYYTFRMESPRGTYIGDTLLLGIRTDLEKGDTVDAPAADRAAYRQSRSYQIKKSLIITISESLPA